VYSPNELTELRNAYIVLNIPHAAPSGAIKKAYRNMIKKWHPDLFPAESDDQALATEMTQKITQAYCLVKNAPLQNHIQSDTFTKIHVSAQEPVAPAAENMDFNARPYPVWLRIAFFVIGAFIGAVFIAPPLLWMNRTQHSNDSVMLFFYIAIVIACGIGSERYGEIFWKEPL
jgi:hypothetical protein